MIELNGLRLEAVSVAGLQTCIQIPQRGLAFDMGVCLPSAVHLSSVLFTHAHVDHLGGIISHCATRGLRGLPPPTYVFPEENVEGMSALFAAWRRLDRSDLPCRLVPLAPNGELTLPKGVRVRSFRSPHRVPCLGYALFREQRLRKPEWQGRSPEELRAAALSGVELDTRQEVCEVAFTGDTVIDVVEREPLVREARLLIMEVTFLDDRVSVAQTRSKGHVHLDEVIERASLFENQAILFTHLSARYSHAEALEILQRRLPDSLAGRVHLLAPRELGLLDPGNSPRAERV